MNPQAENTLPMDHSEWTTLLSRHVNQEGMVDYKGFNQDRKLLESYIDQLKNNGPNLEWSEEQQLSFWINAYNALTIRLILDYYPVKSIKEIGSAIKIPFISTGWDIKVISLGDEDLTLNNIEHNIIRKNFDEPRIHFALVCAAKSCPKLRNEAYTAEQLDGQLSDQARQFLSNPDKNIINKDKIELSKIFSWYGGDFTNEMTLIEYLNRYSPVEIDEKARKSYMDYDWSLNEQ